MCLHFKNRTEKKPCNSIRFTDNNLPSGKKAGIGEDSSSPPPTGLFEHEAESMFNSSSDRKKKKN